jgi:hypothetical protein
VKVNPELVAVVVRVAIVYLARDVACLCHKHRSPLRDNVRLQIGPGVVLVEYTTGRGRA